MALKPKRKAPPPPLIHYHRPQSPPSLLHHRHQPHSPLRQASSMNVAKDRSDDMYLNVPHRRPDHHPLNQSKHDPSMTNNPSLKNQLLRPPPLHNSESSSSENNRYPLDESPGQYPYDRQREIGLTDIPPLPQPAFREHHHRPPSIPKSPSHQVPLQSDLLLSREMSPPSSKHTTKPLRSAMKAPPSLNYDTTRTHVFQGYKVPVRVHVNSSEEEKQPYHYAVRTLPFEENQPNSALYLRPEPLGYPKPLNQADFLARQDNPKRHLKEHI